MSNLKVNVQHFFSDELKVLLIDELESILCDSNFPKNQVNVDFHIKEGKMKCSKPWNTQFSFDSDSLDVSKKIINFLGEGEDPAREDIEYFESWRNSCCSALESRLNDNFRKNCVKLVFETEDISTFPLKTIKVIDIDITQRPENDKVLVVRKDTPKGVHSQPVTSEIIEAYEIHGIDINEFIKDKKNKGDFKYKYITSAEWRKHFYDITVSLMIDYSPEIATPSAHNIN